MPSELDLLRSLNDEPDTPSTVDIRRAMSDGRRRKVRRQAGYASAAALTAIAVTGTSVAINLTAGGGDPAPQAAASGQARPPVAATAPVEPGPASCKLTRLSPPDREPQALISGGDPTGRYHVGRSYPRGGGYQAVIWDNGKATKVTLPGDSEELLGDVNSSGTAVGWSYQEEGPFAYAYHKGKVVKLPWDGFAQAQAVNDAGTIVGSGGTGRRSDGIPLKWSSVTAAPTELALPPDAQRGYANDIGEDGTVVGSADLRRAVVWSPDGKVRELPKPVVDGKQTMVAQAFHIAGDWVTGMATVDDSARATGQDGKVWPMRWNLRTGTTEIINQLDDPADGVSPDGWTVGTDRDGYAVLATGKSAVRLPDLGKHLPEGTATLANAISADGRTLGGQSDDKEGVIQAVVWRCA